MDGKQAGEVQMQFSGQLVLTPLFAKGTGENEWLRRQALGWANHGGELSPPE